MDKFFTVNNERIGRFIWQAKWIILITITSLVRIIYKRVLIKKLKGIEKVYSIMIYNNNQHTISYLIHANYIKILANGDF